ncbi:glycosyltransferase family 39 protein [bacterium]|nr:glycosyltransferase family 39 protein [bacterium]
MKHILKSNDVLKNGYSNVFHVSITRHKWPVLGILFFLVLSFLIISSGYNHLNSDAGIYGRSAKIFYEQGRIDTSGAAPALIGQLLFTHPFFLFTGFNLRMIHIAVYVANFLMLLGMYLLLTDSGVNRFIAFWGALTLIISPISFRFIDWYMTEPFFMFYLIFSLLFFIKGLRKGKILYLYIGSLFCVLGILTRQHALSVAVALLFISIVYYKKLNKKIVFNSIAASMIPLISIGLFYMSIYFIKKGQPEGSYSYTLAKNILVSIFTNPFDFILKLYYGILFFLHYIPLYLAPLFLIFYFLLVSSHNTINYILNRSYILIFSIFFVLTGTALLYSKKNQLMPYLPSIFSIGALTDIFGINLIGKNQAAKLLTIFTGLGAIIILTNIMDFFCPIPLRNILSAKRNKKPDKKLVYEEKKTGYEKLAERTDFAEKFLYLWGIIYIALTILLYLLYDRYIYPLSVLIIYIVLKYFVSVKEWKKMFIITYLVFFVIFIHPIMNRNLHMELEWEAAHSLIEEGISPYAIHGGLGFNNFYSFTHIDNLYKDVDTGRPVNWHNLHPLAIFFVTSQSGLEKRQDGIVLYKSLSRKRFFGLLEKKIYIYKRRDGYSKPVFI